MTLNKSDLIDMLTKRYDVNKLVGDIFNEISNALQRGDDVSIRGFGTFSVKEVKGHPAVHPTTKERTMVPAYKKIVFRPGNDLVRAVRDQ